MGSSVPLFDALAATYDDHFAVPHRRAYDDLAWELIVPMLPRAPATIVDAGCGVGRWVPRLLEMGHRVIAIEQAPGMVARARRFEPLGRFELREASMEDVDLPIESADMILAMGSLQYVSRPGPVVRRFETWLRPGGVVCILVDSLLALVVELLRRGEETEAFERLGGRVARWSEAGEVAEYHLFDASALRRVLKRAGLEGVEVRGLLVTASILGMEELTRRLATDRERQISLDRRLSESSHLADLGKQLIGWGRRPG